MTGHSGFHLFEVDVFPVQTDLAYQAPILIHFLITHAHVFAEDHFRKAQPGLFAKRLMRFGRIDPFESDPMLRVRGIEHRDRVAVSDRDHATGQFLPA